MEQQCGVALLQVSARQPDQSPDLGREERSVLPCSHGGSGGRREEAKCWAEGLQGQGHCLGSEQEIGTNPYWLDCPATPPAAVGIKYFIGLLHT